MVQSRRQYTMVISSDLNIQWGIPLLQIVMHIMKHHEVKIPLWSMIIYLKITWLDYFSVDVLILILIIMLNSLISLRGVNMC